ncbi:MAG: hypothetical protein Fur0020_12980 [Thermodesulfovibrionia bacterium]
MKTLVIIVTIIGLSAVIGSIIVGTMVFEGKVTERPYETGLRYDEMEKAKEEIIFDIETKDLKKGENELIFTLKDKEGRPITDPQLTLKVSRPSTALYDRQYPLNFNSPGRYSARVSFPLHGYWDIKIEFLWHWRPVMIEKRVYVFDGKSN